QPASTAPKRPQRVHRMDGNGTPPPAHPVRTHSTPHPHPGRTARPHGGGSGGWAGRSGAVAADRAQILRALYLRSEPGQGVELRALVVSTPDYRRPHTVSGCYDDPEALVRVRPWCRGREAR